MSFDKIPALVQEFKLIISVERAWKPQRLLRTAPSDVIPGTKFN